MKAVKEEISGRGLTRYVFHLGKEEAEMLLSLVDVAFQHTPKVEESERVRMRLRNMRHAIKGAIPR